MHAHTMTANDDAGRCPESMRENDEPRETRRAVPDQDEPDTDESGYGYGV